MAEFLTIAKLWPAGTEIDLGTDSNVFVIVGPPTPSTQNFRRNAAPFVTSPDGTQNYQFLFWNTGRRMTNKRRVHWHFSVPGWGTWTATKWYGTPSNGGGPTRVRADAFTIGGDAPLNGTPIDGTSTYAPPSAWPFNGDDHVIGTAGGEARVVAKDPFPSYASSSYDFAGWLQLVWGGDPIDEFPESDAGTSGGLGGTGFYDHVVGGAFPVAVNTSADLLATYGTHHSGVLGLGGVLDLGPLRELFYEVLLTWPGIPKEKWDPVGDPSPMDLIRLKLLQQFMLQTRPGSVGGTDFQRLIEAAPLMSKEELKRSMQSLKTTLELGKTALSAIDAQLKRGGP